MIGAGIVIAPDRIEVRMPAESPYLAEITAEDVENGRHSGVTQAMWPRFDASAGTSWSRIR
jgi:hypothetical protein